MNHLLLTPGRPVPRQTRSPVQVLESPPYLIGPPARPNLGVQSCRRIQSITSAQHLQVAKRQGQIPRRKGRPVLVIPQKSRERLNPQSRTSVSSATNITKDSTCQGAIERCARRGSWETRTSPSTSAKIRSGILRVGDTSPLRATT